MLTLRRGWNKLVPRWTHWKNSRHRDPSPQVVYTEEGPSSVLAKKEILIDKSYLHQIYILDEIQIFQKESHSIIKISKMLYYYFIIPKCDIEAKHFTFWACQTEMGFKFKYLKGTSISNTTIQVYFKTINFTDYCRMTLIILFANVYLRDPYDSSPQGMLISSP